MGCTPLVSGLQVSALAVAVAAAAVAVVVGAFLPHLGLDSELFLRGPSFRPLAFSSKSSVEAAPIWLT